MPCQCSAEYEKMHREVEAAHQSEIGDLKRRLVEKDRAIRAQIKEIGNLRSVLSACWCMDKTRIPMMGGVREWQGRFSRCAAPLKAPGRSATGNGSTRLAGERAELAAAVERLKAENARLARSDRYHNGPHAPPSQNSILAIQRKARRRASKAGSDGGGTKRPGRKKGHEGVSHRRKSEETVLHMPERCHSCEIGGPEVVRRTVKQYVDVLAILRCAATTHVEYECRCAECGAVSEGKFEGGTEGTSMGPNLLTLAVRLWDKGISIGNIRDLLVAFGARFSKAAVQHAVAAGSRRLGPEAEAMAATLAESRYLKMDETPITILCRQGYVWVCIGDDAVVFKVVGTRGRAVIYEFLPYTDKPAIVDGYVAYLVFKVIQRCWAHILRKAEELAEGGDPQMAALHGMLQSLFHEAKLAAEDPDGTSLQRGP